MKGEDVIQPGIPESFHVLLKELQSLGLSMELMHEDQEDDLLTDELGATDSEEPISALELLQGEGVEASDTESSSETTESSEEDQSSDGADHEATGEDVEADEIDLLEESEEGKKETQTSEVNGQLEEEAAPDNS